MIYLTSEIPDKVAYIICIGDLHFGDKAFKKESLDKLKGYVEWVQDNPNSRVVLGGDLFNVATRESKTSPFEQVDDEFEQVVSLFEPIKKQIVGAIDGNHENRLIDFANFSLINAFCQRLKIPYMGISGVINFKVGKKRSKEGGQWCQSYMGYFHHTTGGGALIGGGLNRVEKLGNIIEGCDFYCGFHSHKLSVAKATIYRPNAKAKRVDKRVINFLTCGGYLEYDGSYAERGMMRPTKLGSPRIRLDSNKLDVHINI